MRVGFLVGVTYLGYILLTSLKKDETAAHCCDPALSVLQVLVIVLTIYFFWLIRSFVDPLLAAFIECSPLQSLVSHNEISGLLLYVPARVE